MNLSEVLLLRLRATFHTFERKFYLRTHVKITRQWKSISVLLGLRRWHDALRSLVRIARFLLACVASGIVWVQDKSFGSGAVFQKKGVGTRRYNGYYTIPPATQARFLPASCPAQRSTVEVTSKFPPSHFPWWWLTSIDIQCEYSGILFLSPQKRLKQRRVSSAAGFVRK